MADECCAAVWLLAIIAVRACVYPRREVVRLTVGVGDVTRRDRLTKEDRAVVVGIRLSASDASFYQLENTATPMYVRLLLILRRPRAGLSYEGTAGNRRTAAAADTALSSESPGEIGPGQAGVDRRSRLRHHLLRPAVGPAVAGSDEQS